MTIYTWNCFWSRIVMLSKVFCLLHLIAALGLKGLNHTNEQFPKELNPNKDDVKSTALSILSEVVKFRQGLNRPQWQGTYFETLPYPMKSIKKEKRVLRCRKKTASV